MVGRPAPLKPMPTVLWWLLGGALCASIGLAVFLAANAPPPPLRIPSELLELHAQCQNEPLHALGTAIDKGHRSMTAAGLKMTGRQLTMRMLKRIRATPIGDGRCIPVINGYVRVAIEDSDREAREGPSPRTP